MPQMAHIVGTGIGDSSSDSCCLWASISRDSEALSPVGLLPAVHWLHCLGFRSCQVQLSQRSSYFPIAWLALAVHDHFSLLKFAAMGSAVAPITCGAGG